MSSLLQRTRQYERAAAAAAAFGLEKAPTSPAASTSSSEIVETSQQLQQEQQQSESSNVQNLESVNEIKPSRVQKAALRYAQLVEELRADQEEPGAGAKLAAERVAREEAERQVEEERRSEGEKQKQSEKEEEEEGCRKQAVKEAKEKRKLRQLPFRRKSHETNQREREEVHEHNDNGNSEQLVPHKDAPAVIPDDTALDDELFFDVSSSSTVRNQSFLKQPPLPPPPIPPALPHISGDVARRSTTGTTSSSTPSFRVSASARESPRGIVDASFSSGTDSAVGVGTVNSKSKQNLVRSAKSTRIPKAKVVIARRRGQHSDDTHNADDDSSEQQQHSRMQPLPPQPPGGRKLVREYSHPRELLEGRVSLIDLIDEDEEVKINGSSVLNQQQQGQDRPGEHQANSSDVEKTREKKLRAHARFDDEFFEPEALSHGAKGTVMSGGEIDMERIYGDRGDADGKQRYGKRGGFFAARRAKQREHADALARRERERKREADRHRRNSIVSGAMDRVSMAADPFIEFITDAPAPQSRHKNRPSPFARMLHKIFRRNRASRADTLKAR